jgi:hypothetical protein
LSTRDLLVVGATLAADVSLPGSTLPAGRRPLARPPRLGVERPGAEPLGRCPDVIPERVVDVLRRQRPYGIAVGGRRGHVARLGAGRSIGNVTAMPSVIKSVTFDCSDALVLATFWAAALGSDVDEDSTATKAFVEPAGWGGPTLWFQAVPEGKTAKNRMHFDLRAPDGVPAEVARLVSLGASVVRHGTDLVVMADAEGNEFCVE